MKLRQNQIAHGARLVPYYRVRSNDVEGTKRLKSSFKRLANYTKVASLRHPYYSRNSDQWYALVRSRAAGAAVQIGNGGGTGVCLMLFITH